MCSPSAPPDLNNPSPPHLERRCRPAYSTVGSRTSATSGNPTGNVTAATTTGTRTAGSATSSPAQISTVTASSYRPQAVASARTDTHSSSRPSSIRSSAGSSHTEQRVLVVRSPARKKKKRSSGRFRTRRRSRVFRWIWWEWSKVEQSNSLFKNEIIFSIRFETYRIAFDLAWLFRPANRCRINSLFVPDVISETSFHAVIINHAHEKTQKDNNM